MLVEGVERLPGAEGRARPGGDALVVAVEVADEGATTLDLLPVSQLAVEVVVLSAIAVGACVSVCGAIGFVGLIAPFAGRKLTKGHPGRALIPSALIGAILLLLADMALRLGPPGRPIPIGVLTTVLGTPLFIWIVVTMRRSVTA